jgi:bifunctional oligoribonuclease and PAP phosphatase NrnA
MTLPNDPLARAFDTILPVIGKARSIVISTHLNPDGDAIGSELALAEWLAAQGKNVRIFNHDDTPAVYRFLDPSGRIEKFGATEQAEFAAAADIFIVADTNHPDRLASVGPVLRSTPAVKVCIDHHLDPDVFMDHAVIDPDATSTGEILVRLFEHAAVTAMTPTMATCLYTAIVTDTGSFRYPRVDPDIFQTAARLIEAGADPVSIYTSVYEQWSPGRIRLLGETLASLRIGCGGKLASVSITRDMLERTGTKEEDTDNFTTYPMSVSGVTAGILFLETSGGVKISVRSRGDIPINLLARRFGGNGHKNAAGARISGTTINDIRESVISAAEQLLDQGTLS